MCVLVMLCMNCVTPQLLVEASEGRLEGHMLGLVPPASDCRTSVSFTWFDCACMLVVLVIWNM